MQFLVNLLSKNFGSNIFQFCGYRRQRKCQKSFNQIFKIGWFSWYHSYVFFKTYVKLTDAEFNAESIGTSFKSQKWKIKKLVCSFLIALFHFETNLIK